MLLSANAERLSASLMRDFFNYIFFLLLKLPLVVWSIIWNQHFYVVVKPNSRSQMNMSHRLVLTEAGRVLVKAREVYSRRKFWFVWLHVNWQLLNVSPYNLCNHRMTSASNNFFGLLFLKVAVTYFQNCSW